MQLATIQQLDVMKQIKGSNFLFIPFQSIFSSFLILVVDSGNPTSIFLRKYFTDLKPT